MTGLDVRRVAVPGSDVGRVAVRPVQDAAAMDAVRAIRDEVFVVEQGVDPAIEHDALDGIALHILAVDVSTGSGVGTARSVHVPGDVGSFRLGRMAVLRGWRGGGVGRALVRTVEAYASLDAGASSVRVGLHAQTHAEGFYSRLGYRPVGGPFLEAGIEHRRMVSDLESVRPVRDADAAGLVALVGECWAEYEGCRLDTEVEERWMLTPGSSFAAWVGSLWVVDSGPGTSLAASVGLRPTRPAGPGPGWWELKTLYVNRAHRGRGSAERLVRLVESEAADRGAADLELWSDTRFHAAHRLYERLGWRPTGQTRNLHDISKSVECRFVRRLRSGRSAVWRPGGR